MSLGEPQLVLAGDGRLFMSLRTTPLKNAAQAKYHHALTFSLTDGETWAVPTLIQGLGYNPNCDGSFVIVPGIGSQKEKFIATFPTGDGATPGGFAEWRHNLTSFVASTTRNEPLSDLVWSPYKTLDASFAAYSSLLLAATPAPTLPQMVHVAFESGNETAMQGNYDPERATSLSAITFLTFPAPLKSDDNTANYS